MSGLYHAPDTDLSVDPALEKLLEHMVKIDASDLYLTVGSPPVYRVAGVGYPGTAPLDGAAVDKIATALMTAEQQDEFRRNMEMNFAVSLGERARFRVNVFRQKGATGLVLRLVRTEIKSLDDLGLPQVLADVALSRRGLVLIVGATGSGKSTTLAAMIDHRNRSERGHIVTIEDPIEFVHRHKKSLVTQREVGVDTVSFGSALKNTLRQAPDAILIGEIRDVETMEAAVTFAETGHLCLSTLHSNNANQAMERVLSFFPPTRHAEVFLQLSLNLRAIVSQRLIPARQGGRAVALEILLDTPRIRDLIKRGEVDTLKDAMDQSTVEGCRTFDGSLFELYAAGVINVGEALRAADRPNNLRIRMERFRANQGSGETDPPLRLKRRDST